MKVSSTIGTLKEIIDIVNSITGEAKFEFEPDGVHVRAIDSARVAMADLFVSSSVFESYEVSEKTDIPLELERVRNVLKLGGNSEPISITSAPGKLKFTMGNLSKSIALLEYGNMTAPKLPAVNPENYVVVNKSEIEKGLRATTDVRDSVKLSIEDSRFVISSRTDSEDAELILERENCVELVSRGGSKSSYPSDYLMKIIKSTGSADKLKLAFNNDYPLIIEPEYIEKSGEKKVKFFLAPRME